MMGAITGDIIGSIYEINNIKTKDFVLFTHLNRFTDDTVMTCAVALSCIEYTCNKDKQLFKKNLIKNMQLLGRFYPCAGYGANFCKWLLSSNPLPYNSWGNGSAMRVSSIGMISSSLEEVEELAKISAEISHNHPEGIKGAKAIASAVWLLRNGYSKRQLEEFISKKYYNINFKIDDIRKNYKFDVSCQGSVPQAVNCFLQSSSFEDCIRNAVSIGGDSDTIAAIAGSLAEAYYGIPVNIENEMLKYLDNNLKGIILSFYSKLDKKYNNLWRKK